MDLNVNVSRSGSKAPRFVSDNKVLVALFDRPLCLRRVRDFFMQFPDQDNKPWAFFDLDGNGSLKLIDPESAEGIVLTVPLKTAMRMPSEDLIKKFNKAATRSVSRRK